MDGVLLFSQWRGTVQRHYALGGNARIAGESKMMKDKNRYMFCSDCGYAFKEDEIFKKAYTNTAICLCRECALILAQEITDQYVDIHAHCEWRNHLMEADDDAL